MWLRLDSIGDNILSSSMLPYIKNKFKKASITVVCQEHIAELYEMCPFVEDIIKVPHNCDFKNDQLQEVLCLIKNKNPDFLLNSVFSPHGQSDLPGLEFIPKRISFNKKKFSTYTDVLPSKGEWELEILKHERFLKGLGIHSSSLQPKVWLSPKDENKAKSILSGINTNKLIVLFTGTRTKERYYNNYWKALKGLDYFVITLGSKNDYNINQEQLDKSCCNGLNLSGKLSLRESIAVLKSTKMAIGGETGLAHAACAVKVPNIILVGGGYYGRFMPYTELTTIIDTELTCSKFRCKWKCNQKGIECITKIDPIKIREAILR